MAQGLIRVVCLLCGVWLASVSFAEVPPAVLLATTYADRPSSVPLSAYWVSEKLDGVRAVWDGHQLLTRNGNVIQAPAWFTAGFPLRALDGELWLARGQFERLSGIVRRELPNDDEWRLVSYQLFELPGEPGDFSHRLEVLKSLVQQSQVPWLQCIEQFRVADEAVLQAKLRRVLEKGGEGLILHRADALWQTGRSDVLLKYKPFDDAEAEVVAYLPGRGRYLGLVGALQMRLPDGRLLALSSGLSDQHRASPPPIGAQVTYRYRGLTRTGLPRFASFLRVRRPE